ncbi:MAG: hypothetical protein HN580_03055 [Deltaproteobacteria bacterium]|jgi:hypothetical protein|nr:hypothetical protein [Deltaproteobacteria bacterium]MBT4637785.1 hypothetical protein [Deltaproteobacteria bacterium]MBT6504432.1 hypothetical protein [Deltaproteobacteria bacterium]MBT7887972.1 hypothetical protein [Deltaproteobacteria bacterium]
MTVVGMILKSQTQNTGTVFYRVVSIDKTLYTIKALCKIRKGFQTTMYTDAEESQIMQSEVGFNYLEATRKETALVKKMLDP